LEGVVAVCNVEEVSLVLVMLVDAVAVDLFDADIGGGLVDLTERWIDCLLLLLAIEAVEEEVAVLQLVVLVDDDAGVDLDLESLFFILLSSLSFFDLYCRVDLDCLVVVVVVATISVDGCLTISR